MSHLPEDLIQRIDEEFLNSGVREAIKTSLNTLWNGGINVRPDQLARGIMLLAGGDYERFKELRRTFCGDPRDLLCEANSRLQNPHYWFSQPFDQMGPLRSDDE